MANKKSFIMHIDSLQVIEELDMEQRGELLTAILNYQLEKPFEMGQLMKIVFIPFKNQFDRDKEKYNKICETNRENASKKAKKNEPHPVATTGEKPTGEISKTELSKPIKADNDSNKENAKDKATKKETVKETQILDFGFSEKKFLELFSSIKKEYFPKSVGHKTLTKTDQKNFYSLLNAGMEKENFEIALHKLFINKWAIDSGNDVPTHFLINDNFNRYFSQAQKDGANEKFKENTTGETILKE